MKTIQKNPIVLLILIITLNASATGIREQLKQINRYWNYHTLADKLLDDKRVFASDRELIQLHLQLVEKTLRASYSPELTHVQKKNRFRLLDALHNYWIKGQFPRNTGHSIRTPYFIDKFGTACAVGQLIIYSGNLNLARQISFENNNDYIAELVRKYSQIKDWANEYGFTIDELAWIQPCYNPPPDTLGLRNPSCHTAMNGYFCPDFNQLQGPLTKSFYQWNNTAWVPHVNMCGQRMFYLLDAGKYKWEVIDNFNAVHTFTAELTAPPEPTVAIIQSGDFNSCNGVITVSVQGWCSSF